MSYVSLDKKYRPKSLNKVVGQPTIISSLEEMIYGNKLPSAIMIAGPYGIGKTTLARLIAKYVNCKKGNGNICVDNDNLCVSCKGFENNKSPNVVEVNAANARGIDEVRALIEQSRLAPLGGKKRVFILDEIHQLTNQSSQAMLKPLEEPPAKTMWILCTTEPQKILKTIKSRCLILNLKLIPIKDITKMLNYICKEEKKELPEEVLQVIAEFSQGHARDAVLMLEQVLLYTARKGVQEDLANNIMAVFDSVANIPPEILAKKYIHALLSCNVQTFELIRRTENHRFLLTLSMKFLKNMIFYIKNAQNLTSPGFDKLMSNMSGMHLFNIKDLVYIFDLHLQAFERTKDYDMDMLDVLDLTALKCMEHLENENNV